MATGLPHTHFHTHLEHRAPSPRPRSEDPTVREVRDQIVARNYKVDPELVAEEILRKLRLVRTARQELGSAPGRNPAPHLH